MREGDLFHGIEVKSSPARDDDGQILDGLFNYSVEIVINGTHFFSAWKVGTHQQMIDDKCRIEAGIVGVTRIRCKEWSIKND